MKQIKLSIIIANYNYGEFLPKCIDSVLAQSYNDFEIVISDDCSTDNSAEIITRYASKHPRIKTIFNKLNLNVSRNRHQAILAAQGEYITTLDSDDYYYDDRKLEKEMEIIELQKTNHNKEVCAFSNIAIVDGSSHLLYKQWPDESICQGDLFKQIFARSCMIPRDFIIPRKCYDQIGGYDPRFNIYDDWDLKIRLSRIAEFHYTGIIGVGYRRKGFGVSYVPVKQHIDQIIEIWEKNKAIIHPEEEDFINSHLLRHLDFVEKNQA